MCTLRNAGSVSAESQSSLTSLTLAIYGRSPFSPKQLSRDLSSWHHNSKLQLQKDGKLQTNLDLVRWTRTYSITAWSHGHGCNVSFWWGGDYASSGHLFMETLGAVKTIKDSLNIWWTVITSVPHSMLLTCTTVLSEVPAAFSTLPWTFGNKPVCTSKPDVWESFHTHIILSDLVMLQPQI